MNKPPGPLMIDLPGTRLSSLDAEYLSHPAVGGVILFTRNYQNPEQIAALISDIRAHRPGMLVAADTEGGRVQRFREGFFALPPMRAYGRLYERAADAGLQAARAGGWMLAAELRAIGVDLAFAPVLDLDLGLSGVIGDRALSGDPDTVLELGSAVCAGMRSAGMAATGKHCPGHGSVAPDSHAELPIDTRSWSQIDALDLFPFAALANSLPSIMMAHLQVPAVDAAPTGFSRRWVTGIVRERMGYRGAIFTDDLGMGAACAFGDLQARADMALAAGCDMMPACNCPADVEALLDHWRPVADVNRTARLTRLAGKPGTPLAELQQTELYLRNAGLLTQLMDEDVQTC